VRQEALPSTVQRVSGRARYANQAHKIRVADGHETDAKAAQLRKPPNRVGLFFLRVLGSGVKFLRRRIREAMSDRLASVPATTSTKSPTSSFKGDSLNWWRLSASRPSPANGATLRCRRR
jgi:hypothetical protein